MPWLGTVTVVGVVVLVALVVLFLRIRMKDLIDEYVKRRSGSSRVACRANFVEGIERIPVALALTDDTIYYENPDLQASLELQRIEEVEYDDETATGQSVGTGKALRLRSHGHTFEFLLDSDTARKWQTALPPHRIDQGPAAQAV
jgi:hypothetical protein